MILLMSINCCEQITNQLDGWAPPGLVLPPLNTRTEPGAVNDIVRAAGFMVCVLTAPIDVGTPKLPSHHASATMPLKPHARLFPSLTLQASAAKFAPQRMSKMPRTCSSAVVAGS
jgi:hypothetical protein